MYIICTNFTIYYQLDGIMFVTHLNKGDVRRLAVLCSYLFCKGFEPIEIK